MKFDTRSNPLSHGWMGTKAKRASTAKCLQIAQCSMSFNEGLFNSPLTQSCFSKHLYFLSPSDLVDYDSEIYANGALESGANPRYQQILQQQQRSPIDGRAQQGYTNNFRQIQQVII